MHHPSTRSCPSSPIFSLYTAQGKEKSRYEVGVAFIKGLVTVNVMTMFLIRLIHFYKILVSSVRAFAARFFLLRDAEPGDT